MRANDEEQLYLDTQEGLIVTQEGLQNQSQRSRQGEKGAGQFVAFPLKNQQAELADMHMFAYVAADGVNGMFVTENMLNIVTYSHP